MLALAVPSDSEVGSASWQVAPPSRAQSRGLNFSFSLAAIDAERAARNLS